MDGKILAKKIKINPIYLHRANKISLSCDMLSESHGMPTGHKKDGDEKLHVTFQPEWSKICKKVAFKDDQINNYSIEQYLTSKSGRR